MSTTLYAVYKDRRSILTFHSNSGTGSEHEGAFSGGMTTSQMSYVKEDKPYVVKANNIIDAETASGPYTQSSATSKTYQYPGASSLSVKITYMMNNSTPSTTQYISIYKGKVANGTVTDNRIAYLSTATKTTQTYIVQGDTLQIW